MRVVRKVRIFWLLRDRSNLCSDFLKCGPRGQGGGVPRRAEACHRACIRIRSSFRTPYSVMLSRLSITPFIAGHHV